jgi:hypothetical protein
VPSEVTHPVEPAPFGQEMLLFRILKFELPAYKWIASLLSGNVIVNPEIVQYFADEGY